MFEQKLNPEQQAEWDQLQAEAREFGRSTKYDFVIYHPDNNRVLAFRLTGGKTEVPAPAEAVDYLFEQCQLLHAELERVYRPSWWKLFWQAVFIRK